MNGMAVFCDGGTDSFGDFYQTAIYASNYESRFDLSEFKLSGPVCERWFDIFRQSAQIKKLAHHGAHIRQRRDPARKCVKDAHRWKRRRFVQRLAA